MTSVASSAFMRPRSIHIAREQSSVRRRGYAAKDRTAAWWRSLIALRHLRWLPIADRENLVNDEDVRLSWRIPQSRRIFMPLSIA